MILHLRNLVKNWSKDKKNIPLLAKNNEQIIIFDPLKPDIEEIIEKITN